MHRGLCDPTDLPAALLRKAKTQPGSRGAESPALSPACCRPPIRPARPFLGIHQILPLKANSERRPRSPARSLGAARDCSRSRSRFGEEHVSVYLGRGARRRLGMLSALGTLCQLPQRVVTPPSPPTTRNLRFLGFWVLFWAGSIHHPPAKGSQASSPACPSHSSGRGVN